MAYYDFTTGKWVYDTPTQPTITVAPPQPTQPLKVASQPANLPSLSVAKPVPQPTGLSFFKYPDSAEVFDSAGHHYSSLSELNAAGGAGKVQTVPRPVTVVAPKPLPELKVVSQPTPGAQPAGAKQLMPAIGPTSPEAVKAYEANPTIQVIGAAKKPIPLDQVKQPSQNLALNFIKSLPGAAGKVATDVLQAAPRAAVSVLSSAFNKNDAEPIVPETGLQKFFTGSEPIVPIARRVADMELKLQDKGFGKLSLPVSSTAIIAGTTLDLLPTLGGGDSKAFKEAAGILTEQLAKGVLKDEALNTVYKQFGTQVGKLVEQKALPKIEKALLEATPSVLSEAGQKIHIPIGSAPELAPKLELPAVTKTDSLLTKLKNMLSPIKGADPAAQATYKEFVNSKLVGKELANQEARGLSEIPKKEGWSTILKYEKGEATPFTTKIQQVFDNLYNEAIARGLEVPYLKNYVPQMYRNSPQEVTLAVAKYMKDSGIEAQIVTDYLTGSKLPEEIAAKLKLNPSFTETRVLPNYETALKYGLTPKYTHPAQLAAAYRDSMESAIANKKLITDLVEQGKLTTTKGFGMKPVDLTFSPTPLFAEPKLATALNNIAHDSVNLTFGQAVLKKTAGVSKFMQELALSAGFPGTDVNFFSIGQLFKQLTTRVGETLLHPLTATVGVAKDLAAFARANLDSASIKFFEKKAPIIQKMAANGIDISERVGNFRDMYSNMVGNTEWGKLLGKGWDKTFQKKTFASFMPQLYVNTFEATYKTAIKRGLTDEVASRIAADTTKAFHGLVDDVARSKNTQDALSAALFAPKFREGIINTLWNTGKSVTTQIRNPAFSKNRQLATGMILTYGGYQYLNHKLNGQYTWQNEPGHEFDLRIPLPEGKGVLYVPFMPSFLSLPRNIGSAAVALYNGDVKGAYGKATSLLSMPLQISGQILNNQDYFGNPIYKDTDTRVEKLKKIGTYLGLQANHPYLKLIGNYIANKQEPDKAFRKPLTQSLIEASEFPVKFETLDRISRAQFYAAVDKTTQANADAKRRLQPVYDQWQKLTDAGDVGAADELISEKNMSEDDFKIFKSIRSGGVRSDTVDQEGKIYQSLYLPIQELRKSGNDTEAQARINAMSDDEYKAYDLLRNRFGGL